MSRGPRDPALLILTSLAGGARHGHALMKDIADFAGVRLGPGTLYGAIARLEEQGLIAPEPEVQRRRPYRLTPQGRAELRAALAELDRVARAGRQRLQLIGGLG